jgi:autotransporter-associated beta strand protein
MKIDQRKFRHLSVNSRRRRTGAALASLTVISLLGATAQAQIWIGAGGDDNWSTAENWSTPPATGSTIHFAGTLRPTPSYDLTDHLAYIGIVFDTGAAAFTLGGNSIIVTNVIENDSAVPQIVNMDVNQGGGGGAFLVRPVSGDLIFNGVISGTAQVQKNNNFTATFNGANTFTGPVSITGAGEGLKITSIRNVGGAPNSLGQPALANSVIQIGIAGQPSPALNYIGTGDTCDRVVNINTAALANGAMLKQSGTGLLKFTGGVTATDPAATQRRLFLDGSSSGTGEIAGNIAKAGGGAGIQITKQGTGTWALSAVNASTSGISLNAGKLVGVTGGSWAGACTVAAGATSGVRVVSAGGQWTQASLTFNASACYAEFDFGATVLPSTTVAPLQTTGNITLNANTGFIIKAGNLPAGTYPLMKATGTLTGTPSATLTLPPRVAATLTTTTGAGGGVNLVVTTGTQGVTWAAGTGSWDINTTSNWTDSVGASKYLETTLPGDAVLFDDTPTGTGPFDVTVDAPVVSPIGVTVNGTKDYTLSGSGGIAGTCDLTKNGTGRLTLGTTNTYTGETLVKAGTLALASTGSINNTANLTIAAGATFDVSAINSYALPAGAGLTANGTDTAAAIIKGGTTVSFGSRQVALTFVPTSFGGDTTHPALVISQGTLMFGGNGITVNNAGGTALGVGVYRLIQVGDGFSGTITGTPTASAVTVTGAGLNPGTQGLLAVSGGNVDLVVSIPTTLTRTSSLPSATYGDEVTLTATVAATPAPSIGTVQFYDNGIALGDPATVTDGTATYTTTYLAAGSHPITASYTGGGGYTPSSTTGSYVQGVSQKPMTITLQPQTKQYGNRLYVNSDGTAREERWDGSNWVTIATGTSWVAEGLVNGEILTSAYVGLAAPQGGSAIQPAGEYPAGVFTDAGVATFTGTNGFTNTNYTFTRVPATYTVTQAPLTITAAAREKFFGESLTLGTSAFAVTPGQLMNGQTVAEVTLTATSGPPDGTAPADPVGLYAITPSAAVGGNGFDPLNYNITYANGVLTVKESAYAAWKTLYFGANANDPEIAGDLVDYDTDGIPNLVEFALNGNPTLASSEILPKGGTEAGHFQLSFTRPAPADVVYVVQASADLATWSDIATLATNGTIWSGTAVVTETGAGATRAVTVRDPGTIESAPTRFLRLRISR